MHAYSGDDPRRIYALGMIATIAVVVAITVNWLFSQQAVVPSWLFSAPTLASVFGIGYLAMDRYCWRWAIIRWLGLVETPLIEGEYIGTITSTYQQQSLPVRVCVDQTWTRIAVRFEVLNPASSTSISMTAGLRQSGHNHARLTYTYRNQVQPGIADPDMNDHDGTAELGIGPTGTANGRYYNFRGRQGTMVLQRS